MVILDVDHLNIVIIGIIEENCLQFLFCENAISETSDVVIKVITNLEKITNPKKTFKNPAAPIPKWKIYRYTSMFICLYLCYISKCVFWSFRHSFQKCTRAHLFSCYKWTIRVIPSLWENQVRRATQCGTVFLVVRGIFSI